MSTQAVRFLQQEGARLQRENETLKLELQEARRAVGVAAGIYWRAQEVLSAEEPLVLFQECLENILAVVGAQDGSLAYWDRDAGELVFVVVQGGLQSQLSGHRIKDDIGVAGWSLENSMLVVVDNTRQDWRFSSEVDQEFAFLTRSILCVPVMSQDEPIGVIEIINKPTPFIQSDIMLATMLADLAAKALEKRM
ncbi:MAG: GAF domain-containing protein [Anaerolineae bacterium]|nr:GAF domain-containing protein [Anaerolineae bacterium]